MSKNHKEERVLQIIQLINSFCEKYLNEDYNNYALKLCEKLARKRTLSITNGKVEICAASIVYVIARLNFLFDIENPNHITSDTICDFFNTNKSTTGNKATQIEKACNIKMGDPDLCVADITDAFTYYKTPEGFIVSKNMLNKMTIEFVDGEEAEELKRFEEEKQQKREQLQKTLKKSNRKKQKYYVRRNLRIKLICLDNGGEKSSDGDHCFFRGQQIKGLYINVLLNFWVQLRIVPV